MIEKLNNSSHRPPPESIDEIDFDLSKSWDDSIQDILFSNNIHKLKTEPLLESALMQWVVTRWRSKEVTRLADSHSHSNIEEIRFLSQLATTAPGTLLSILPTGKITGISPQASSKFRNLVITNQDKWPGLAISDWMLLLCIDSLPKTYPHQLYKNFSTGSVAEWEDYVYVVNGLMKSVTGGSNLRKMSDVISTIFYELFKNTHDHAREGIDGSIIGDSIRSIYARYYPLDSLDHLKQKGRELDAKTSPVEWYIQTILKNESAYTNGFLELSVFDMGPGLAAKWLLKPTLNSGEQVQYDAVISCLEKGQSSVQKNGRGFGLWNVLQALKKQKGFIRIRTNQVHAYRQYAMLSDLGMQKHSDGSSTIKEILYDWKRLHVTSPSRYPSVEGTLISILLPMGGA